MAERQTLRLRQPPPSMDTEARREWERRTTDALNQLPPFSTFSYATPESNVTALRGTIGVNMSQSASTASTFWFKQQGDTNTGWAPLGAGSGSGGTVYSVGTIPMRSDGTLSGGENVWYFCSTTPYQNAGAPGSFAFAGGFDSIKAFPFWSSSGFSVQAMGFRVNTASASGSARLAIYDTSDYSSLYPGNLIAESSATSTAASSTLHIFSDFSCNLEPQTLYWFCYLGGTSSANINGWNTDYAWHILGRTNFVTHAGLGWAVTYSFDTFPPAFPASAIKVGNLSLALGIR